MHSKSILPNGVTIVTETIPHLRSVSVGFWIKCGSRNETRENSGVSHFIEHMLFKGTKTRTARQIAEEVDASGGQLNAFTTKEHTCFYARVLDEQLPFAVEMLSDMLLNSVFDREELAKERGVILEEIGMYEDTPEEVVHDLLAEAAIPGHPLALAILGTKQSVMEMDRQGILNYMHKFYIPANLVVAAAGRVNHGELVELVSRHLGTWGEVPPERFQPQMSGPPKVLVRTKDTEQVHFCLATLAANRTEDKRYPLQVLDMLLGGGMSSRLFQELREQRGLVYSTYTFYYGFMDIGVFGIYAAMNRNNLSPVVDVIFNELHSICHQDLTVEVARAKEQLKGSLVFGLESTVNRMSRLAKGILYHGEPINLDAAMARIEAVTASEVTELAADLFRPSATFGVSVIGPVEEKEVIHALSATETAV